MTISDYLEPKILDAVLNHTALDVTSVFVKLLTGDPGEAGTSNAATETTRKSASFAAASGGSCVTDADLTWSSVAGSETISHVSLWDASTAGNNLWNGPLGVAKAVVAGDTFQILSGQLTVSVD